MLSLSLLSASALAALACAGGVLPDEGDGIGGSPPGAAGGVSAGASGGGGISGGGGSPSTAGSAGAGGAPGQSPAGGASSAGGGGSGGGSSGGAGPGAGDGGAPTTGGSGNDTGGWGEVENPSADCEVGPLPSVGSLTASAKLPDPFKKMDGTRITNKSEWRCRREEIRKQALEFTYVEKPETPASAVSGNVSSSMTYRTRPITRHTSIGRRPRSQASSEKLLPGVYLPGLGSSGFGMRISEIGWA